MPDWGMLSSGVSSLHGTTRSPWDPAWTTGGSSSGAGAAAAGGYGPLHVGTDIGGSIRLPGSWLGLVALKPSAGRVPLDNPYLGRVAGPLARTVADAALLMQVLSRPDPRDWTSLPPEQLDWLDLDRPVAGLRVGLHLDAGCGSPVEPAVAEVVRSAAATFEAAGAAVEELPAFADQGLLDALDQFWRVRSWNDFRRLPAASKARVLPYIVEWVHGGADVPGSRVLDCYHRIAQLQERTVAATLPFDLVLSPVAPGPAFPAEQPMPVRRPAHDDVAHRVHRSLQHVRPAGAQHQRRLHRGRPAGRRPGRPVAASTTSACCGRPAGSSSTGRPPRCPAGPTTPTSGGPRDAAGALPAGAAGAPLPADRRAGRERHRERLAAPGRATAERARAGGPVRRQPADRARGAAGAGEQRRGALAPRRPPRAGDPRLLRPKVWPSR